MTETAENLEILKSDLTAVNECQVAELKRAGAELDPEKDCVVFVGYVRNVEASVIHTYLLTASASIRQPDPKKAAMLWKEMASFCEGALIVLRDLKGKYDHCGVTALYDLVLDYSGQAQKRYYQNLQDSECQTIPAGLFAEMT
jgi:hypothetical protein